MRITCLVLLLFSVDIAGYAFLTRPKYKITYENLYFLKTKPV